MNAREDYDALADAIEMSDITSNVANADILRRLKEEDESLDSLYLVGGRSYFSRNQYRLEGESARSMGWLGYYVGQHTQLKRLLFINERSFNDILGPFFTGLKDNKTIQEVCFYSCDVRGGGEFTRIAPFIESNVKLASFEACYRQIDPDQCRALSLALGKGRCLTRFNLMDCGVGDEHIGDIVLALSMHPHIESIGLWSLRVGRNGCVALSTLLQWRATALKSLELGGNEIDDEGVQVLANAIAQGGCLQVLRLSRNPSITIRGLQALATLLEAPNSSLRELYLGEIGIGNDGAALFATALKRNCTLKKLDLCNDTYGGNDSITEEVWVAFSQALCDTSSGINGTFMSNHTLQELYGLPRLQGCRDVKLMESLTVNKENDRKTAALIKILEYHDDIDVEPLFEWEFKTLPFVIEWIKRTAVISFTEGSPKMTMQRHIGRWELSTIYRFVRGMPAVYIEARLGIRKNDTPET